MLLVVLQGRRTKSFNDANDTAKRNCLWNDRELLHDCTSFSALGPFSQRMSSLARGRGFFFFIFKKHKISKIYVGFGKFQKYTPVALWGATGLKCNFFFFKFATKSLERKKRGGPVAPPVAHPRGDRVPCVNTANWNNCFRSFFFENIIQK